jgi:glycosyltransferase involved in cell wall biosynthesis
MSDSPKLTIVIPTFNRPELLPRALRSCLDQTVQAQIIIADDGDCDRTNDVLVEQFPLPVLMGQVRHLRTGASYAWANWRAGMDAVDTPYAAWVQDDDVVHPCYVERIVNAFDVFPDADVWFARIQCAPDGEKAMWYSGTGPWCPMDMKYGRLHSLRESSILASTAYFVSWSLSPAIAYRATPHFRECLKNHPEQCDIFVERLLPAMAANGRAFIPDPAIVAYWIQHGDQLSHKQHKEQPEQTKRFLPMLDGILDKSEGWEESLAAWCLLIPANTLVAWAGQCEVTCREGGGSRYDKTIRRILIQSLRDRVQFGGERRWWKRARNWVRSKAAL